MKRLGVLILVGLFLAVSSPVMAEPILTTEILTPLYGAGNYVEINGAVDQIWMDLNGGVLAKAKYAGDTHRLGYSLNEVSGGSNIWFAPNPFVTDSTASFDITPNSDLFIWSFYDNNTDTTLSSLNSLNPTPGNYMRTFKITNLQNTYVIAWEDRIGGDYDYNDLVVEVEGAKPVPEPTTMLLLGLGLVGLAGLRRKLF